MLLQFSSILLVVMLLRQTYRVYGSRVILFIIIITILFLLFLFVLLFLELILILLTVIIIIIWFSFFPAPPIGEALPALPPPLQVKHYLTSFMITDAGSDNAMIVSVNAGFTAITGYSQEEVLGTSCLCLCGPDTNLKVGGGGAGFAGRFCADQVRVFVRTRLGFCAGQVRELVWSYPGIWASTASCCYYSCCCCRCWYCY